MRAVFIDSVELAPEIRHMNFFAEGLETFKFVPGQFVSLSGTVREKKITRAYSVVSIGEDGNRFSLCLNKVEDGFFSPHLFSLLPGEGVDMKGPIGTFVLRNPVRDSVMIATGTGIAPFRPMLAAVLGKVDQTFTLIFGVRYELNLLYRAEFEALAARHANFKFIPTVTRPSESWQGATGRVQTHMLDAIAERRDIDVYVCGLNEMVSSVRETLLAIGFDKKQIIHEKYD